MRGVLVVGERTITINGPSPVNLNVSDVTALSFTREFGLFHIVLKSNPIVYVTPILVSFMGFVQIMMEGRNTKVYSALHRLYGGPGRCAKCGFDLRVSLLPCPECGHERVRPVA